MIDQLFKAYVQEKNSYSLTKLDFELLGKKDENYNKLLKDLILLRMEKIMWDVLELELRFQDSPNIISIVYLNGSEKEKKLYDDLKILLRNYFESLNYKD